MWGKAEEIIQLKMKVVSQAEWHMPLILALRRYRQTYFYEFEASMVYKVSSRTVKAMERNPVSKKKKKKKEIYDSNIYILRIMYMYTIYFY